VSGTVATVIPLDVHVHVCAPVEHPLSLLGWRSVRVGGRRLAGRQWKRRRTPLHSHRPGHCRLGGERWAASVSQGGTFCHLMRV